MSIRDLAELDDEEFRRRAFPVVREQVFLAHAGVTALPRCVRDAVVAYTDRSMLEDQEFDGVLRRIAEVRATCASMIGAQAREIALLGPTSLGLSLFANGLSWQQGDEVVCYLDDYPANVYPWQNLERQGVKMIYLRPDQPGEITPDLVAAAMTERTRLVALASAHFLTGYRIDIEAIGRVIHDWGALFSLDGIQTVGAFETRVDEVDFLSADAHKWMLGPLAAGIVYVKEAHFDRLRPSLLGAWNVRSPDYVAQDRIRFESGARRYEPGVLNCAGIFGMAAALELIQTVGLTQIEAKLLRLGAKTIELLQPMGFELAGRADDANAHAITTFRHPRLNLGALFGQLRENGISVSLRQDRNGSQFIRVSPHFYNTETELHRLAAEVDSFMRLAPAH